MERFVKGDVVVVPFPFSDLSGEKKRPALVIANLKGNDLILCQITSQNIKDEYAIKITDNDFNQGSLKRASNVRSSKIFTEDEEIILYKVGRLKDEVIKNITGGIAKILES